MVPVTSTTSSPEQEVAVRDGVVLAARLVTEDLGAAATSASASVPLYLPELPSDLGFGIPRVPSTGSGHGRAER